MTGIKFLFSINSLVKKIQNPLGSFSRSSVFLIALLLSSCLGRSPEEDDANSEIESILEKAGWYKTTKATIPGSSENLLESSVTDSLDIRGVGDSAWTHGGNAGNRPAQALAPAFGKALKGFDPKGLRLKGHLSFINWESVIGEKCSSINDGVDYYFLSHPENIRQAAQFGFNIFSVANNHARDCFTPFGPDISATNLGKISLDTPILWHGTGPKFASANVREMDVGGRKMKVAFGALTIVSWEMKNTSQIILPNEGLNKVKPLLESLQKADADLRILSIHTQDASGHNKPEASAVLLLKTISETFINAYGGHVVFGHGPHTAGGVRVIERADGRNGVVFVSLGNFLHNGVSAQRDNYVARVLLDPANKSVVEVQTIPFRNVSGPSVQFESLGAATIPRSNFTWQKDAKQNVFYAKFK